jgi:hypothetical protein
VAVAFGRNGNGRGKISGAIHRQNWRFTFPGSEGYSDYAVNTFHDEHCGVPIPVHVVEYLADKDRECMKSTFLLLLAFLGAITNNPGPLLRKDFPAHQTTLRSRSQLIGASNFIRGSN